MRLRVGFTMDPTADRGPDRVPPRSGCDRPRLRALARMRGTRHARYLQTLPQPYSYTAYLTQPYSYAEYAYAAYLLQLYPYADIT